MYELISTEGIFYRPSIDGGYRFTMKIFKDYLIAPFDIGSRRFNALWTNYINLSLNERINLLQLNWVAMTTMGTLVAAFIIYLKNIF